MMPDHAQPRPATASAGAWPAGFTEHRRGIHCPMCANDFAADDIGRGLLVRRGEVSNAYLWRSGQVRGYSVVICTGHHVAYAPDAPAPTDEADDTGPFLAVIDLERSEPGPAVRDLVRLSDAWHGRPELYEAFLAGYGRPLTPAEEARLVIDAALDSVSGIAYGSAHGDPELVERGRRTLARLRAAHHDSLSPAGETR
jgi:hypothetical protein